MAYLAAFGAYLPRRVITNGELSARLQCTPEWIFEVSGIEERRYADPDETVADMAVAAANACLERAGESPAGIGAILVASSSAERRFPGPAAEVAHRLGLNSVPAFDIPVASAGSLFGLSLANHLAAAYGSLLVVASEKMSTVVSREPLERSVAILFGDGAGACLVRRDSGAARIVESVVHSDGSFAGDLRLDHEGQLMMNGRSVIMQASRKIPAGIREVLAQAQIEPAAVEAFLMHQANQNLIDRVARALDVPSTRFFSNIRRYGNTSSASMLIAAAEWWQDRTLPSGAAVCFAAFGAGFHWGALLARGTSEGR